MNSVQPITPQQAKDDFDNNKPWFVVQAFNTLISKNFDGNEAKFEQNDVIDEIIMLNSNISRDEIFKNHWLDVESFYKKAGWKVIYHKPDYTESFPSYFKFKK